MFKDFSFIVDIDGTICPIKGKEEKYEDIVELTERNIESCLSYLVNNPSVPYGAIYLLKEILKSLEKK